ncbi:MAG: tyrosine-type recombinase/integrase [Rhodospirillales bacterium]|nr:tyrosine-type recombinase/integrase [Rhodospirillales bacterium]
MAARQRHYPARDMRWMELRGRTFYVVMAVPRPLWARLGGKRRLVKSLGTRDHGIAVARRFAVLAEFQRAIEGARTVASTDELTSTALSWRQALQESERDGFAAFSGETPDGRPAGAAQRREFAMWTLAEATDAIASSRGSEAAEAFENIALGVATPLLLHVDAWLKEGGTKGPLNPRTAAQYRADVTAIAEWAKQSAGVVTVEAFTPTLAGRYVTQELIGKGVHWGTANRKITSASSYWRWMRKRAGVKEHPWQGQSVAKGGTRETAPKRPFTDAEAAALLAGNADPELADAMRVAALSGMRLEELYRLTVADCAGGWFRLRRAKTRAGLRRVPIHSELTALVARRCEGKAGDAFLFHEAGPERPGRERSAALSKRFGRYRQDCGVHDREEGKRHSRVDFHSFRRWFVTRARNAGIDRAVVAAVVGHEVGNLTDDVYSGGPAEALLRACIEAVRLPA